MTKEYNKNPKDLTEAKKIITETTTEITRLAEELTRTKAEKDTKEQEWVELNNKYTNLLAGNQLSKEELIAQAQAMGMKTDQEYQQALQANKNNPTLESEGYSWLWWLLIIPVLYVGWGVIKGKFKSS